MNNRKKIDAKKEGIKGKDIKRTEKKSVSEKKTNKSTESLIPIVSYDEERRGFLCSDGSYLDIMLIRSRDRGNLAEEDIEIDCLRLWRLLHVYADDLKIVTMNFPLKLSEQLSYFRKRQELTHNPIHKDWLKTSQEELLWLEENLMRKEYYLMLFGKDEKALIENRQRIISNLGRGRDGLIDELSEDKKYQIIARLYNMNAAFLAF